MWAVAVLATGGGAISLLGMRVVSRDSIRPAVVAAVLLVAGYAAFRRGFDEEFETIARGAARSAPIVAAVAALAASAAAVRWGTFAASGADASGYVSQAALWRHGRLTIEQPLAARVGWPNADAAFAPLGYTAARHSHAIVPSYPPGLPVVMAAAQTVAGACAAYFVVPAAAGAAVWFCYVLGSRARSPAVGLIAALLLACSPVFVYQALMPMSDVPAAACWTAAIALTLTRRSAGATRHLAESAAAGCVAALAILIRPTLVPLAAVLAPFVARRAEHGSRQRVVAFAAPVAAACTAIGGLNLRLYGSALQSGYGALGSAFALRHVPLNIAHWRDWVVATETPLVVLVALVGMLVPLVATAGPLSRRSAALFAASVVTVVVVYVGYEPFDEWTYLRFLLPAFPPLLVATASAIQWMLTRVPAAIAATTTVVLVGGVCGHNLRYLATAGAGSLADAARRYVAVARFVSEQTPSNAVYISLQHSGSLRYYCGRPALRFDRIDVDLDRALADLRRAGFQPYVVLEDWEETQFKQQFAATSESGKLAGRPMARLIKYGVNVYDLQTAERSRDAIEIPPRIETPCIER